MAIEIKDAPASSHTDAQEAVSVPSRDSWLRTPALVAALLALLVLCWLFPLAGLPLTAVTVIAAAPLGGFIADRLAMTGVFLLGAAAVGFTLLHLPVALVTVQGFATLSLLLTAVAVHRSPAAPRLVDPATAVVLAAIVALWSVMALPLLNATAEQVLSYLVVGWDHSSHFTMFLGSYQQGVTGFVTDDGELAFGSSYPGVLTWLWAAAAHALPVPAQARDLLYPYVMASALTAALGLGMLCAVASDMARRIARHGRSAAAAAAISCGLFCLVGSATAFQDHGHVNYMMAVVVGLAGCWYGVTSLCDGKPWQAWAMLVSAALFTVVTYPPVAAMLVAAAVAVTWQTTRARPWLRLVALMVAGAILVAVAARWGIGLDTITSVMDSLVVQQGGLPPLDVMLLLITPVLALLVARHAATVGGSRLVVAVVGGITGLAAVAGVLSWRVLSTDAIPLASSYYTVKLWLGVWLVGQALLAVVIAMWFSDYLNSERRDQRPPLTRGWVAVAWVALVAVVGGTAGYVGPRTEALPTATPIAEGLTLRQQRIELVTTGQEGQLVLGADAVLNTPGAQPILWDGGEVKNNHYLMALNGQVGTAERALIATFPVPFNEAAVESLSRYLTANPEHRVQIAWFREESLPMLRGLRRAHRQQVELHRM